MSALAKMQEQERARRTAEQAARELLTRAGYVVVPKNATPEMMLAALNAADFPGLAGLHAIWRAMVEASQIKE